MKTLTKPATLFVMLVIWATFAVAQIPLRAQQPVAATSSVNNVQLVIEGKVVNVHDGDTVTVLDQNSKKHAIRLQGIDAPELKQEFGAASQKNLSGMVMGKQVTIVWNKVDKYRRTVGTIMLDGRDINIEQVRAGVAWHFKKYEDEQSPADRQTYAAAELEARTAKLGLWKGVTPMAPGDWRQEVKAKRWGPAPPAGTVIGSANSKKYHRPDCPGYRDMAERNRVFFKSVAEAEGAGFKRAGNCPAELVATVTPRPVGNAATVSNSAITRSAPSSPSVTARQTIASAVVSGQKIIGNKNSKSFHQPWCPGYENVAEQNRIFFETVIEAEAAGYKLAGNCTAAETTEVAIAATPSPAAAPVASEVTNVAQSGTPALKIIGNKNSNLFHQPWCSGYERVSEKNRIFFENVAEAEAAGFKRAGNCRAEAPAEKNAASTSISAPAEIGATSPTPKATTPEPVTLATTTPDPAPTEGVEKPKSTDSTLKVVGNKNSKIFHLPGCSGYDRVSEKNRVYFNSAAEAETAGYRIAKNCSPADSN